MIKKWSILKLLRFLLVFLTFSAFVVSCSPSTGSKDSGTDTDIDISTDTGTNNDTNTGNNTNTGTVDNPNSIAAPISVNVSKGDKENFVKVVWTANDAEYYWIYYSKTNDPSTATLVTRNARKASAASGYQFALPEEAEGNCYFWIKAADGSESTSKTSDFSSSKVYNFYYFDLLSPNSVTVTQGTGERDVTLTWSNNYKNAYYWIYSSRINKPEKAVCKAKVAGTDEAKMNYSLTLPDDPGTYYFWIKSADGNEDDSPASSFSTKTSIRYETTELITPPVVEAELHSSLLNVVTVDFVETGAACYRIYQNTTNNPATAKCVTKDLSYGYAASGYSISLCSSGTYYFWVKAAIDSKDTSDTSDFSDVVSFDFTHIELDAPTGLAVEAGSKPNSVKLTWTANNSRFGRIYYSKTNDPVNAVCATKYNSSTSGKAGYEVVLQSSGKYYFWMKSADSTDDDSYTSDFSEAVSYDFTNSIPALTGLTLTAEEGTNNVKLTWTPDGSDFYWIYCNNKNETESATCLKYNAKISDAAVGYTIVLKDSGTYYFWVLSSDKSFETYTAAVSSFGTAVSYEFTNPMSAPSEFSVVDGDQFNTVLVKWTPNDSTYYRIYYNTENDPSTAVCAEKAASEYSASVGYRVSLPESGKYYFWMKSASGSLDSSATSDFTEAVPYDFTYYELAAPTQISVEDYSAIGFGNVKLKWKAFPNAWYYIYYNTTDDASTATLKNSRAVSSSSADGYRVSLPSKGTYYFWIKTADSSLDTANISDFSDPVSYEFKYPAPKGLAVANANETNTVNVSWTPDNSSYYWIYYGTSNDPAEATLLKNYLTSSDASGFKIILPVTGYYYIWVKGATGTTDSAITSDFGDPVTYDFVNSLSIPTGLNVSLDGNSDNTVIVTWNTLTSNPNTSGFYWIYYNTTNDTSTATCKSHALMDYDAVGYSITLSTPGKYYFWIRSSSSISSSAAASDFSSPKSCTIY